jgi:hypothetical protein
MKGFGETVQRLIEVLHQQRNRPDPIVTEQCDFMAPFLGDPNLRHVLHEVKRRGAIEQLMIDHVGGFGFKLTRA